MFIISSTLTKEVSNFLELLRWKKAKKLVVAEPLKADPGIPPISVGTATTSVENPITAEKPHLKLTINIKWLLIMVFVSSAVFTAILCIVIFKNYNKLILYQRVCREAIKSFDKVVQTKHESDTDKFIMNFYKK